MFASVLLLSLFCKALVFKWNVWSKRGAEQRPEVVFWVLSFVRRKTFLCKEKKNGPIAAALEKYFAKEIKLTVFVLPRSSLALFLDFVEVIFHRWPALRSWQPRWNVRQRREGQVGTKAEREDRDTQGEWSMQKKKIPFTVRERRWTMSVIYRIKTAFTHT